MNREKEPKTFYMHSDDFFHTNNMYQVHMLKSFVEDPWTKIFELYELIN